MKLVSVTPAITTAYASELPVTNNPCAAEQVTVTTFEAREMAEMDAQPLPGGTSVDVVPAPMTAIPQPFLKSLAAASVRVAEPELIEPVVVFGNPPSLELHPPAGM